MSDYFNKIKSSNIKIQEQVDKEQKFRGFDFLRAFFSIAIVADHSGLFTLANLGRVSMLTDILYANVGLLAVPVFFQISLFLLYFKSEKAKLGIFFKRRITKLIYLYIFWVFSLKIFSFLFLEEILQPTKIKAISTKELIISIMSGGNSPFYFFFSLLFVTAITIFLVFLFRKLTILKKKIVSYLCLSSCCALVLLFSAIDLIVGDHKLPFLEKISNLAYWAYNPLNFLPYIFTAAIVYQDFNQENLRMTYRFKIKLWILFSLFLLFIFFEWIFLENLISYSRLSLIFGSWLLLYVSILSKSKVPIIVKLISDFSLGIYTFHLFFTHVIFVGDKNLLSLLFKFHPKVNILIEFIISLLCSIALTILFRRIRILNKFV